MKLKLGNKKSGENFNSFELLTENEMFTVRGGTDPVKPISSPRDVYDFEEN